MGLSRRRLILPELREQFLGCPGAGHFQIQFLQGGKLRCLFRAVILRIIPPELAAARERFVPLPQQFLVLLTAHFVHRLVQVFADMKLVMHRVRAGHLPPHRLDKRRPQVHGRRRRGRLLFRTQTFPQLPGRFRRPVFDHLYHARLLQVGQPRETGVAPFEALLIQAQILELIQLPPLQPSRDGALSWIEHARPHSGHLAADPHGQPSSISTFFSDSFSSTVLTPHGLPMPKSNASCFCNSLSVLMPKACPPPCPRPAQNPRPAERSGARSGAKRLTPAPTHPPTFENGAGHLCYHLKALPLIGVQP